MYIRAYLRASTKRQNADRARESLQQFADQHDRKIGTYYTENESGAKLTRPELLRMLDEAHDGDILLIEAVDRLTRLSAENWDKLNGIIKEKGLIIVSMDLPTSHAAMAITGTSDDFQGRMLQAVNSMLLDMLAAISRKDYEQRRERQAQGIAKLKSDIKDGKTTKQLGAKKHSNTDKITVLLEKGVSWTEIEVATGCSRSTVARVARKLKQAAA